MLKGVAAFARKVVKNDTSSACWVIYNQPKEPENMAERLKIMK